MGNQWDSEENNASRRKFLRTSGMFVAAAGAGIFTIGNSAQANSRTDELYASAKKEGKLVWRCGHLDRPAMQAVRKAFMDTYPGIDVDAVWQTGEITYTRIQQDIKAGVHEVDAFGTSNEGHWPVLKKQNVLAEFQTSEAGALVKAFKDVDPDNTFRVAGVELAIIDYRSDKVSNPPSKWKDFLDPEWTNKLTLGSPAFSGNVLNWTIAMLDKYGDSFLTELAKRNPKVGRAMLVTGTDILSGERLVGHGVDANTFLLKAAGNPIDVKFPEDDAILSVGSTGILKSAPHPNAARLFMEFNDSREYSKAMSSVYRFPIRADVPSFSGLSLDKLKIYKNSVERLTTGGSEAVAKWKAVMGI